MKPLIRMISCTLVLSVSVLTACSYRLEKIPSVIGLKGLGQNPGYKEVYAAVLGPKCSRCHGGAGGVTVTDYASTRASISAIKMRLEAKTMPPPPGSLSDIESSIVLSWISKGAPEVGSGDAPGSGGGSGNPAPLPPLEATYTSLRANVFEVKCLGCHHSNQNQIPSFETYEELMNAKVIKLSNPEKSELLKRLDPQAEPEDQMPPSGSGYTPVTKSELEVIRTWINEGAPR